MSDTGGTLDFISSHYTLHAWAGNTADQEFMCDVGAAYFLADTVMLITHRHKAATDVWGYIHHITSVLFQK